MTYADDCIQYARSRMREDAFSGKPLISKNYGIPLVKIDYLEIRVEKTSKGYRVSVPVTGIIDAGGEISYEWIPAERHRRMPAGDPRDTPNGVPTIEGHAVINGNNAEDLKRSFRKIIESVKRSNELISRWNEEIPKTVLEAEEEVIRNEVECEPIRREIMKVVNEW